MRLSSIVIVLFTIMTAIPIFHSHGRGTQEMIKVVTFPDPKNVQLRVTNADAKCGFEYAIGSGAWKILAGDLDATLLTTDVAGGFVGATVGPHARVEDGRPD